MMASSAVGTKRRAEDSERAPAIAGVGLLANSTQCLIGGVWVSGAGPVIRELRSPIDSNHIIAKVQEASPEQVGFVFFCRLQLPFQFVGCFRARIGGRGVRTCCQGKPAM
jgi:hypothetical protein